VGTQLEFLPVAIAGWAEFKASFSEGQILLRPTDSEVHSVTGQSLSHNYDRPPYAGYDSIDSSPFLYRGTFDGRLLPMERVASVTLNDFDVAYPCALLSEHPVVNDIVEGTPITVFFDNGTESAFTASTGNFTKSGSTTLFQRTVDNQVLTFELVDGVIADTDTGST